MHPHWNAVSLLPTLSNLLNSANQCAIIDGQFGFSVSYHFPLSLRPSVKMARVYSDVNSLMPRAYWDYDSVNISWGLLENYEVVRKIGRSTTYSNQLATRLGEHAS